MRRAGRIINGATADEARSFSVDDATQPRIILLPMNGPKETNMSLSFRLSLSFRTTELSPRAYVPCLALPHLRSEERKFERASSGSESRK